MTSQSEIILSDDIKTPGASKARKTRTRRAAAPKRAKREPARKTSKPAKQLQSTSVSIVPVMTLRAIDIVDEATPKTTKQSKSVEAKAICPHVIQMPPSLPSLDPTDLPANSDSDTNTNETFETPTDINGEPLVTDPELLELLEQLSVTIDTANTVLEAAATLPAEGEQNAAEEIVANLAKPETEEMSDQKTEPAPVSEPAPGPVPAPETETEDLPPLAARLAPDPALAQSPTSAPAPAPQNIGIGFGLVANTALTGLVFAAGVAWVLHTNPWLLEEEQIVPVKPGVSAAKPKPKLQASLQSKEMTANYATTMPSPAKSSFTPPDEDPAPMETLAQPASALAAALQASARGPVGQPIALNIPLPDTSGSAEMSVMIQGVPDNAKLSSGKNLGSGNWLLNEPQLKDVTLTAGKGFKPGNYELEVILVRSDGKVPETRKVPVSVEPLDKMKIVKAPPQAVSKKTIFAKPGVAIQVASRPASPPPAKVISQLAPQEIRMLLTRGNALLHEGDVAGARLLLEYAANSGSKQAMVKLGNSFDPEHLAKLGVRGVQPNEARALHWYDRAAKSAAAQ